MKHQMTYDNRIIFWFDSRREAQAYCDDLNVFPDQRFEYKPAQLLDPKFAFRYVIAVRDREDNNKFFCYY